MTAGSLPRWPQPGEVRTVTAVSAVCGGPVPVTGARDMLARHEITGLWGYAAPPAIWRLSGLDRNCLSAITHLTESRHARKHARIVVDTTIPDRL